MLVHTSRRGPAYFSLRSRPPPRSRL